MRLRATFGIDVCMQASVGYSAGCRSPRSSQPTLFALTMQRRTVVAAVLRRGRLDLHIAARRQVWDAS